MMGFDSPYQLSTQCFAGLITLRCASLFIVSKMYYQLLINNLLIFVVILPGIVSHLLQTYLNKLCSTPIRMHIAS